MQRQIEGFRISPQQERLWLLQQESPAYLAQCAVLLEGDLEREALSEALQTVVARHEILRTNFFSLPGVKAPIQVIAEDSRHDWREVDLSESLAGSQDDVIDEHIRQQGKLAFDFQQGALLRTSLLALSANRHVLLLSLPSLCADTYTLTNLVNEISRAYAAALRGERLCDEVTQYVQFSEWQNELLESEDAEMDGACWRRADLGDLLRPRLPFERGSSETTGFAPRVLSVTIGAELDQRIEELARRYRTDARLFLLTCWPILLHRLSGQQDIVIGVSSDCRKYEELKGVFGPLARYLPAPFRLEGDFEFAHVLEQTDRLMRDLYRWQEHFTWEQIASAGEIDSQPSFFPFGFDFEHQTARHVSGEVGFSIYRQYSCTDRFKVRLSCFRRDDSLFAEFHYDSSLLLEKDIERLAGQFLTLIEAASRDPQALIGDLNILSEDEREELLIRFNDTKRDGDKDACIHRLIEARVDSAPDRVAVVFEDHQLTYAGLNARANRVAHHLQRQGAGPEQIVAFYLERSLDIIVGLLAILKSGAAYLPLELELPQERLGFMLEDSRAAVLLTKQSLLERLPATRAKAVCLDTDWGAIAGESEENPFNRATAENLLYVIFTSGSTGRPKGVALEHRQLLNYLAGIEERLALDAGTSFAMTSTFAGDLGNTAIFPSLCGGETLHIISHERARDPLAMADYFRRHDIGCLKIVPSHLSALLGGTDPLSIMPQQRLILGGEACSWSLVERLQAQSGDCRILNHYGPTEAAVGVLTCNLESAPAHPPSETAPLGRPINNTQIYLLDGRGEPVPLWATGELYIGGASLSRGYLNNPELTAEKFMPNPFSGEMGARIYKTGDLARYQSDGNVEFLGRVDHQVKLRGYRIELSEIEAALRQHPSVQEAVALVREDAPGDKHLVAYVVPGHDKVLDRGDLWRFLRGRLPEYMLPSSFVMLNALPLTPGGKIDRRALPAPEQAQQAKQGAGLAPRSATEEVLANIWGRLLKIERVGVYDNFFEAGGHSLLATQLISRIRQVFEVDLPLRKLFETPTVAGLAEAIEFSIGNGRLRHTPAIKPVSRNKPLPLSFAQQRLWFVDQLIANKAAYNVPKVVGLSGEVSVCGLEQAMSEVVRRHEVLRTRFASSAGEPVQVIDPARRIDLPIVDLSALGEIEQQTRARLLAGEEAIRPFCLERGPLMRATLLRLTQTDHLCLLTMHHIISDAWSSRVLHQEMTLLYRAFGEGATSPLDELPIQFADFAVWQREWLQGELLEEQLAYWKAQLAASPSLLEFPTDRPRPPVQSFRAESQGFALSEDLSKSLRALGREEAATLYMTLLAAFQTLLARYSGQQDIVVGVPIAGRNRVELENLIGFFVNTLAVRTDLSGSPGFRLLLRRVRGRVLEAYNHQDLPFERLVEELAPQRNLGHTPLFQAVFMFDNTSEADETKQYRKPASSGTVTESWTAKFDLTLSMTETAGPIVGSLKYSSDLFDRDRIARLLGHFERIVQEVIADPDQGIWEIPLLSEAERQHMLVEWNDTQAGYPTHKRLPDLIEAQAQQRPEAVAVVFEDEHLTYGELDRRANRLAHYLQSLGAGPEQIIGLCVERSAEMIIGVLGVHRAGAAYVPLDPTYPPERLSFMLYDTRARMLLTQQRLAPGLARYDGETLCLDSHWEIIERRPACPPVSHLKPDDPAYVIYTSGSTGLPKGVIISHSGICNRILWGQTVYQLTESDCILYESSFNFDFSVWEIYGPLMAGARLVLARAGGNQDPAYLAELIAEQRVTVAHFVPSMLQVLIESLDSGTCGALRLVFCGGEALPTDLQDRFFARLKARLYNQYGATEASINSTYWVCQADGREGIAPIGRPLENTQVYLLDTHYEPVPMGVPGELHIGGTGLGRGYLNRPDLTAERFVPNPFSQRPGERMYKTGDLAYHSAGGVAHYLGRIDCQVKIRGFRIELGEIEEALSRYGKLREAVVLAREDVPGDKRLVAYVVPDEKARLDLNDIRRFLQARLPEYMVPSAFVMLDGFPLTLNGKLDRRALPAPDQMRPDLESAYVAPRTPTEELLANAWIEVLGIDSVGIHDNFFDLGGHSLLATRAMSRVRELFQIEGPLRWLFESPTVAELAQVIETAIGEGQQGRLPAIQRADRDMPLPLSFAQQRLWFVDQLIANKAAYNVPKVVGLSGEVSVCGLEQAMSEVVRRHEVLRTRFASSAGEPVQVIAASTPLTLPLVDLSALSVPESHIQVTRLARREASRRFDLARGPVLRNALVRVNEDEQALLLTIHHIATDGWSTEVLIRELSMLYDAFRGGMASPLEELELQYADYACWQRRWFEGSMLEEQLAYWKGKLAGAPPVLELPSDRPRPLVKSFRAEHSSAVLSEEMTEALRATGREEGSTLFMVLLAAFQSLLARYTGREDIVVGTPIAGRNRVEVEGLIGCFVNTLVMRTDLSREPSFRGLLRRVREVTLEAYAHQDMPFERLVEELAPERSLNHAPLFQVALILQNMLTGRATENLSELENNAGAEGRSSEYDLILNVVEVGNRIVATIKYDADLFDDDRVRRMLRHWQTLLEGSVADPDQTIWNLPILTEPEREQLLVEWNDTQEDCSPGQQICELFEIQAEQRPDAIALVYEDRQLSYLGLDLMANRLANYLLSLGVGPEARVGICLERSPELIVGLLAVLKAGGAYVPLDASYPVERMAFMLENAQATVLLTRESLLDRLPGCRGQIICLDSEMEAIRQQPHHNPGSLARAENLAYVIYTSGSTGRPKGVMVAHQGLWNLAYAQRRTFDVRPGARVLQFASPGFDASIFELIMALGVGATLCLARGQAMVPGPDLVELLRRQAITNVTIPPSALAALPKQDLPALETIVVAGEACSAGLVARWGEGRRFFNAYGPTEATVWSSVKECVDHRQPDIGCPIANTRLYILDGRLQPVPAGVAGELHIDGTGLARGYLDRPELTAERFIPNPFSDEPGARLYKSGDLARNRPDGQIEFLGRVDNQVKLRGYRIEPGEIEAALAQCPAIEDVVVLARKDDHAGARLAAYIVTGQEPPPTVSLLRSMLQDKLPEYMIPSAFVFLESLPLDPHGKVDWRRLPPPEGFRPELEMSYVAPATEIEHIIASIWREELQVEKVGIYDNFFDLGGHSLLMARVHQKLQMALARDLSIIELFKYPTVNSLAEHLSSQGPTPSSLPQPEDREDQDEMLGEVIERQQQLRLIYQAASDQEGVRNESF